MLTTESRIVNKCSARSPISFKDMAFLMFACDSNIGVQFEISDRVRPAYLMEVCFSILQFLPP